MTREELARLQGARWEILRVCSVAGHLGATEAMVYHTLLSQWVGIERGWLRDQYAYLESRELVAVQRHEVEDWVISLTRHGDDVANYVVDCEPGIARPPKYWGDGRG